MSKKSEGPAIKVKGIATYINNLFTVEDLPIIFSRQKEAYILMMAIGFRKRNFLQNTR